MKKLGKKNISSLKVPKVEIDRIESKDDRERAISKFCRDF